MQERHLIPVPYVLLYIKILSLIKEYLSKSSGKDCITYKKSSNFKYATVTTFSAKAAV